MDWRLDRVYRRGGDVMGAIIVFAIWIGMAVGCAEVASKKNRSWTAWFVLGLFFGMFALLVASCLSTDAR